MASKKTSHIIGSACEQHKKRQLNVNHSRTLFYITWKTLLLLLLSQEVVVTVGVVVTVRYVVTVSVVVTVSFYHRLCCCSWCPEINIYNSLAWPFMLTKAITVGAFRLNMPSFFTENVRRSKVFIWTNNRYWMGNIHLELSSLIGMTTLCSNVCSTAAGVENIIRLRLLHVILIINFFFYLRTRNIKFRKSMMASNLKCRSKIWTPPKSTKSWEWTLPNSMWPDWVIYSTFVTS